MKILFFISIIFITVTNVAFSASYWREMDNMLKNHVRQPPLEYDKPLRIHVGMYLESLGKFKESEMSYEVDVYLYTSWKDPSLAHAKEVWTINDVEHRKKIWLPDLYFANARTAQFHDVTVPNFNLYVDTEGTIAYSLRTTLTVACALDLHDYPMDNQLCSVKALSYSFTEEHIKIRWFNTTPISSNQNIALPEFNLYKTNASYCDGVYEYSVTANKRKKGKFSCLSADIYLQRSLGHNLLQTYIPLGGIVIVGFTSFFIDRRATPARVTLTFMTLVSLTSMGNGMRFALPQVSYAKAIDFYFFACMLFVFGALIEFALVNSYMRKSEKFEKLATKYKDKKDTEKYMSSPIILSAFQKSYEQMMKMRRKSSAAAFFDNLRKRSTPQSKVKFSKVECRATSSSEEEDDSQQTPYFDYGSSRKTTETLNISFYDNVPAHQQQQQQQCEAGLLTAPPNPLLANGNLNQQTFDTSSSATTTDEIDKEALKRAKKERQRSASVAPNKKLSTQYQEFSHVLSRKALNIDKMSRLLFPLLFTIFNLLYWIYYLHRRNMTKK